MNSKSNISLKCYFPRWFICLACISFVQTISILFFVIMNKILKSEPIPVSVILISVFLLVGGVWLFSMLFSYALATENGLEYINPFRKDRFIAWGNIVEVKRPLFKIPNDYSYVISKENTEKIILIRSMKNYRQMIGLIKEKAPNLRTCNF